MDEMLTKHYEIEREIAAECVVLLKTDGSFPIDITEKIALYGSGARHTLRGGTGGGIVEVKWFSTVEEGLKKAGYTITTNEWLDGYDAVLAKARNGYRMGIKQAIAADGLTGLGALSVAMPEPDYELPLNGEGQTAVYVLTRVSGEGADRNVVKGDIFLTDTEIRDIHTLAEKYPKFMLVLNVSGVVDLSPVVDRVKNILYLSQLGSATGDVLADILSGKRSPSGKLASTWARYEDYGSMGDKNPEDDTRYCEGIYFGYRYFDSVKKNPIFPFGYGLSYTQFSIQAGTPFLDGSVVKIPVTVKNTGRYKGKEVVEIYVSQPQGKLDQPYQILAAFRKTRELSPGEEEVLEIGFDIASLAAFEAESCCRILEAGDYIVRMGSDSRNTQVVAVVHMKETAIVERVSHAGGTPDFEDWKPERREYILPVGVPVLELAANIVKESQHRKVNIDDKAQEFVRSLSDKELCYFCTGDFEDGKESPGLGGTSIPGAAGQTTVRFASQGVPSIIMADGPAGLHISSQYGVDEKGVYAVVGEETKAVRELLPPDILKYLLVMFPDAANDDRGGVIHDQYCTALPIETALAQSWEPALCTRCGMLVAEEMERYGVDIHLAPALNMHRHLLCGRNFEYFSEDPLITGKMAAAFVRGVQSRSGKGSMLKHFVCNEQETNRLNSNSIVSERALRDIYLRSFEIAVKEGKPCAVMTSYNLLNGEHTSERKDLIEGVLRGEWGFEGIVVSDWVGFKSETEDNQKYPRARAYKTVAAGNDLMMPGSIGHYEELLRMLNETRSPLTRKKMEECAARILSMVWKLKDCVPENNTNTFS